MSFSPACLAVDTGGTFTDYVAVGPHGQTRSGKVPSTPARPSRSLERILTRHAPPEDGVLLHGTTVATNALLERQLGSVVLVTNHGLEGLLRVGRGTRDSLYDLDPDPAELDVFREVPVEGVSLREHPRTEGGGDLTGAQARGLRARIRRHDPEIVAVCLVHAYQNTAGERAVREALEPLSVRVVLSSEIHPRFREFERASTTVVSAGLRPRMKRYQRRIQNLEEAPRRLLMMGSSRGLLPPAELAERPVLSVMSGPAAGLLGARALAGEHTDRPLLCMDVGGTSTDVAVVGDRIPLRDDHRVGGYPLAEPMVDLHTLGSGGGSVLWLDRGGHLRAGPRSAGADPGPACYGRGGPPTVTDAHLFLGRIPSDRPLAPEVSLDPAAAERALETLGRRLDRSAREVARGGLRITRSRLSEALRAVTVERGREPGEHALVAYGGGGGLYAAELAGILDIDTVFVPRRAGVTSALGLLDAPEIRRRSISPVSELTDGGILPGLDRLLARGPGWGTPTLEAECRFRGQNHELSLPVDAEETPRGLRRRFRGRYRRVYGYLPEEPAVELVHLNGYWSRSVDVAPARREPPDGDAALKPRPVDLRDTTRTVPFWRLESVARRIEGPSVLSGCTTTVFVPEGWELLPRSPLLVEMRPA